MKQVKSNIKKISRYWKALVLVVIACICVFTITRFAKAESVRLTIEGNDLSDGTWQVGDENVAWTAKAFDPESQEYLSLEDGGSISWVSSDENIVSVTQSVEGDTSTATLRALSAGKATITATYTKTVTDEEGTYDITASDTKTVVVKFAINEASIPTEPFEDDFSIPAITTNSDNPLTWTSSNEDVATASDDGNGNGLLNLVGAGKTTITATTKDGQKESFKVVVNAKYKEATESVTVNNNQYYILTTNAKKPTNVRFESSNASVVSVGSDGSLYGVGAGNAYIYIYALEEDDEWYSLLPNPARYITANVPFDIVAESTKASVGDRIQLTSNVSTGKENSINWTSSDTSVATVDVNGVVTALKKGTVTINANIVDSESFGTTNMQKASVDIDVIDTFSLNEIEHILNAGESFTLNALVTDSKAAVTWESSNPSVVSVTADRKDSSIAEVKAISKGSAIITATQIINGVTKTATCEVSVTEPVVGISVSPSVLDLVLGDQYPLVVNFTPSKPDNMDVTWVSSNDKVVTVTDSGVVKAVGGGQAAISVITEDGIKVASCTVTVRVPVTDIKLDVKNVTASLSSGSYQLTYHINPSGDGVDTRVTWTSSNPKVATVTDNGLVNFIAPGNTTIVVKTVDIGTTGNLIDTCEFTINNPVTAVDIDYTSITLKKDETFRLSAKVSPENATNKTVLWTSSDSSVVKVNDTGLITAVGTGSATILAKSEDSGATSMCNVTVYQPVTSVTISSETMTVRKGTTFWLYAKALPENAMNKDLSWSSNDEDVAIVDSTGKVTALDAGHCTIIATSKDSGEIAKCVLTVQQAVTGIYLNTTSKTIMQGSSFAIIPTITPSDAENKNVIFTSSDTNVATVDANGVVKGVNGGAAIITVKTEERGLIASCSVVVQEFVSKLNITEDDVKINIGSVIQLKCEVGADTATNRAIKWSSSNNSIAVVDAKGLVTSKNVGNVTIYAHSTDGSGMYDSINIRIVRPVTSITMSQGSVSVQEGKYVKVNATLQPSNATILGVTWSSSDPTIATVDGSGTIYGLKKGNCTVTASATDGSGVVGTVSVRVTPTIQASGVSINSKSITMLPGQTRQLTARIKPTNSTESIMWVSGDTSVATVSSNGLVVARGQGNTEIYAISTETGVETSCAVNVLALNATYVTLEQYDSYDLDVFGATEKIKWYTNNNRVATVTANGKVVGRMAGTTTITAKVNGKILYCTVKVNTMKR